MADLARTQGKIAGAPDYDSPEFWDVRFATGQDVGEWLNPGNSLLEALLSDLERRSGIDERSPRVLHLGPGVSQLGIKLRDAFIERNWAGNGIANVDFSAEAVRLGQDSERQMTPAHAMHWQRADLLEWDQVSTLSPFAPFDAILDKSTSDAIATSAAHKYSQTDDLTHVSPAVLDCLSAQPTITLSPVESLALHLVPLTRRGSVWIALSYSTIRFDGLPFLAKYWKMRSRTPLEAPAGPVSSSAHTPQVFHWLYVLDRT